MTYKNKTELLEPGTEIECSHCSQNAKLALRDYVLECSSCGSEIQDYQMPSPDSLSSSMDPDKSHHGPPKRPLERSEGSFIDMSRKATKGAGLGRTWATSGRRMARLDMADKSKRAGSISKMNAKKKIISGTPEGNLRTLSLDLLEFGWPSPGTERPEGFREIWKDGHPFGVGASAAACKLLASNMLGLDCRIKPLCSEMIPNADSKMAKKAIFRSLKSLRRNVGRRAVRGDLHKKEVMSILDMANLGQTKYREVSQDLYRWVSNIIDSGDFNLDPPRSILASLLHHLADLNGIRVNQSEVARLMGCSRAYRDKLIQADDLARRFL